jgi:hypothetical protein
VLFHALLNVECQNNGEYTFLNYLSSSDSIYCDIPKQHDSLTFFDSGEYIVTNLSFTTRTDLH